MFFDVFLAVQPPPFGFMAVQPPLFGFMAVQPPHNTSLQMFLVAVQPPFFPTHPKKKSQRSQFLILPWGYFPNKIPRDPSFYQYLGGPSTKKITEIPVFTTTLGVPPPKKSQRYQFLILPWGYFPNKIPRDPSFYHYLGGPSQKKKSQRSQFLPLSWGSLPKKNPRDTSF